MTYNRTAMRLLFVADVRSPIAQNWIRYFAQSAERSDKTYEVCLASTFACLPDFPVKEFEVIPVAFSGLKRADQRPGTAPARTAGLRTAIRQWFGPLTIRRAANQLRRFIERVE